MSQVAKGGNYDLYPRLLCDTEGRQQVLGIYASLSPSPRAQIRQQQQQQKEQEQRGETEPTAKLLSTEARINYGKRENGETEPVGIKGK